MVPLKDGFFLLNSISYYVHKASDPVAQHRSLFGFVLQLPIYFTPPDLSLEMCCRLFVFRA